MQGLFKNGNFSHVIQLEHFCLQTASPSCGGRTRSCADDEGILLPNSHSPGHFPQNRSFYCWEIFMKLHLLATDWAFEDVVSRWSLSTTVKIVIVKPYRSLVVLCIARQWTSTAQSAEPGLGIATHGLHLGRLWWCL